MFEFEQKALRKAGELAREDLEGVSSMAPPLTKEQRNSLLLAARRDAALAVAYVKSIRNMVIILLFWMAATIGFLIFKFGAIF